MGEKWDTEVCLLLLDGQSKKRHQALDLIYDNMELPQQLAVLRVAPSAIGQDSQRWGVVGALLKRLKLNDEEHQLEANELAMLAIGINRHARRGNDVVLELEDGLKGHLYDFVTEVREHIGLLPPALKSLRSIAQPVDTKPLDQLGGLPIW